MRSRREQRRIERIEQRSAARDEAAQIDRLLTMLRPHMAAIGDDLASVTDPFEAELAGGAVLGLLAGLEQLDSRQVALRLVEDVALQADTSARALLVFMGLGPDENLAGFARQADAALGAAGVADPAWAEALHRPVEPTRFTKITVPGDGMEAWMLALFRRADADHGFLVGVDYTDCGAITMLDPVPPAQVASLVERVDAGLLLDDIPTETEELAPEVARLFLDGAIGATLDHWAEDDDDEDDLEADLLPGRIILLGRHLSEAGLVGRPIEHGSHVPADLLAPPQVEDDRILRLRAGVEGAVPPIWRRVELSADSTLEDLHDVLQAAFGWDDCAPHHFSTGYADYSGAVTLAQLIADGEHALTYRYAYDITVTVESARAPDPEATYPACTAGAEPAPPEDFGDLEAWQDLRRALEDPAHPAHRQLTDEHDPADLEPPSLPEINARLRARSPMDP